MSGDKIVVRLHNGGEFTFSPPIDEEYLGQLGPAILSHLGCSYQISWPVKTDEDRQRREQDRAHNRKSRQDHAEDYANNRALRRLGHFSAEDRELVREYLEDAYKSGWDDAPKPVGFLR